MNAPRNVASTFCVVRSCCSSVVALGVAVCAAAVKAETATDSEKVVTASIDDDMMVRTWSTASAPSRADHSDGRRSLNSSATTTVATARSA